MLTDTFVGTLTRFELSTVKISTDAMPDHANIVTSMADHTDIVTPMAELAYFVAPMVVKQADIVSKTIIMIITSYAPISLKVRLQGILCNIISIYI